MKIVLSTSPHIRHAAVLESDFQPSPGVMYSFAPLGLLSLAGALRRDRPDFACEIYDLNRRVIGGHVRLDRSIYHDIAAELCGLAPTLVGLMTECDSYHHILQICEALKEARPDLFVVLGGPHASVVARETLERCAAVDAVVVGEGEATFVELANQIAQGIRRPIDGAVVRLRDGIIAEGSPRPLIPDLDDLPLPAWDLYQPDPGEEIFLEAGRGCPFQCAFCSTAPYWLRRHRVKSPGRLLREMDLVASLYGTTRVHLTHDLFTANRNWVEAVCRTLIAAGSTMQWTCSARTDTVDDELLALMRQAGCSAIYFGIESGSERMLKLMGKAIPLARSFDVLKACGEVGINANVGFILGFPGEDDESIEATFLAYERALRLGAKPAHIFAFCAFAGASVHASLKDLAFSGQLVDLPLGAEADHLNRQRIGEDRELYGAYFRPAMERTLADILPSLDEFSPLVEATFVPSLVLADRIGNLHRVAQRWSKWITAENIARGAQAHRIAYGSPRQFARFLKESLGSLDPRPLAAIEIARYLEESFRIAERCARREPTTFAGYRSVSPHDAPIDLGSRLEIGAVLGHIALSHDVLASAEPGDMPRRDTYLAWHALPDGSVRLLDIPKRLHDALRRLSVGPASAADILLDTADDPEGPDCDALIDALAQGAREGLVRAAAVAP